MTQNTSTAVMQRRSEPSDSLDDFPTPPWATRAFIEHIISHVVHRDDVVLEPCSNRGFMAKPLKEYFDKVVCTDIKDYGYEDLDGVCDFLFPNGVEAFLSERPDHIFANPPFRLIEQFIERALKLAKRGVFIFARTSLLEGIERYETIFKDNPPTFFAQYSERVVLSKARLLDPNDTYWHVDENPEKTGYRKPSSATSYAWFGWVKNVDRAAPQWIPPCRKEFEREGDYPGNPKAPQSLEGTLFEGAA